MNKNKIVKFIKSKKTITVLFFLLSSFFGYFSAFNSKLNAQYSIGESIANSARENEYGKTIIEFVPTNEDYDDTAKTLNQYLKLSPYFFSFYGYYSRLANYNQNRDFIISHNFNEINVSPTIYFSPTLFTKQAGDAFSVEFESYSVVFSREYANNLRLENGIITKKQMMVSDALADLLVLQFGLEDYDQLLLLTFTTESKDFGGNVLLDEFQISNIYFNDKGIATFTGQAYNPYGVLLRYGSLKLPDTRLHIDFVDSPYTNYKIFEMMEAIKEELDSEINFLNPGKNLELDQNLMSDYQNYTHTLDASNSGFVIGVIVSSIFGFLFAISFATNIIRKNNQYLCFSKFRIHIILFLSMLVISFHIILSIIRLLMPRRFDSFLLISPLYTYVSISFILLSFLITIFFFKPNRNKDEKDQH